MSISVSFPKQNKYIDANAGDNLLDIMRNNNISIDATCGGKGTCGKCKVLVNGEEKLACTTIIEEGMIVEEFSTVDDIEIATESKISSRTNTNDDASDDIGIAIDIGTTTVVIKAIDADNGKDLAVRAFLNPQRPYGADVLSRINLSMDDASKLSGIIKKKIDEGIEDIFSTSGLDREKVTDFVLAGNTTMCYLLMNKPCRALGLAPFIPDYKFDMYYDYAEVFGNPTLNCKVHIYPYISAFVGGDIVAGLVNIDTHCINPKKDENLKTSYMLVDMGTNGEIAYRIGDRLIATSTAAGPALEGGNISCGMGGTDGAIYSVKYTGDKFEVKTIDEAPPVGICGSGVISVVSELIKAEMIEESGSLADGYDDKIVIVPSTDSSPEISFTQRDVREFQLAKGAIRTGIDILIYEAGEFPEVLYLAGGFGQNIDLDSAFCVGLLPEEMRGKTEISGNTALGGCIDACMDRTLIDKTDEVCTGAEEINLAAHPKFNDTFVDRMGFENANC